MAAVEGHYAHLKCTRMNGICVDEVVISLLRTVASVFQMLFALKKAELVIALEEGSDACWGPQ